MNIRHKEKSLLIGLGQIGLEYDLDLTTDYILSHSRSLDLHPEFDLVGAVDLDSKKRKAFNDKYKKPVFDSIKAAIEATKPSLIIIASPSNTHSNVFDEIIDLHTPKTILCEKPLDLDLDKAISIVKKCSEKNINLYVNYFRRSDPGSIKLKKMFQDKQIEGPFKGVVWYSKGIKNNGSHFINLLEYWFGKCNKVTFLSQGKQYKELDDQDYDFILNFKGAEIVFLSTFENSNSYNSIELFFSEGRLFYDNGGQEIVLQTINSKNNSILNNEQKHYIQRNMNKYQYNVLCCIKDALMGRISSISKGEDALETLKIINKIISEGKK